MAPFTSNGHGRGPARRRGSQRKLLAALSPPAGVFFMELSEVEPDYGLRPRPPCAATMAANINVLATRADGCLDGGATPPGAAARQLLGLMHESRCTFVKDLSRDMDLLKQAYVLPATRHSHPGQSPVSSRSISSSSGGSGGDGGWCSGHGASSGAGGCDSFSSGSVCSGGPGADRAGNDGSSGGVDIRGIMLELLARGYQVQLRDECPPPLAKHATPKDLRRCLQQLRHSFLVCVGVDQEQLPVHHQRQPGAAAGPDGSAPLYYVAWDSSVAGENSPCQVQPPSQPSSPAVTSHVGCLPAFQYLSEPLIIDPSFKDQFVIAHPTEDYEALLKALPACFVGTVGRLEAVVGIMCGEMAAAFEARGLPLPPWRGEQAMLSKWCPQSISALARKINGIRQAEAQPPTAPQAQAPAGSAGTRRHSSAGAEAPLAGETAAPRALRGHPVETAALAPWAAAAAALAAPRAPPPPAAPAAGWEVSKFARKASAEWREPHFSSKKVRSLLAAAFSDAVAGARPAAHRGGAPARACGDGGAWAPAAPRGAAAGLRMVGGAVKRTPIEHGLGTITTVFLGRAPRLP